MLQLLGKLNHVLLPLNCLSVNNETKNSAPIKIIIPAQIMKDEPNSKAFLYNSLRRS